MNAHFIASSFLSTACHSGANLPLRTFGSTGRGGRLVASPCGLTFAYPRETPTGWCSSDVASSSTLRPKSSLQGKSAYGFPNSVGCRGRWTGGCAASLRIRSLRCARTTVGTPYSAGRPSRRTREAQGRGRRLQLAARRWAWRVCNFRSQLVNERNP